MPPRGVCVFCDRPVRSHERAAHRIVDGWEIERSQGGANYIALKKRDPTVIAHGQCVEIANSRAKLGLVGQEEMRLI